MIVATKTTTNNPQLCFGYYTRINHQIRAAEVRVIRPRGRKLRRFSLSEAIQRAQEAGLDLIEISPNAVPPVAKIMEYGKFQYEQQKNAGK
jgi:translation initiation factor IF-3